jgi:rhodanese-related sulfurtransferase
MSFFGLFGGSNDRDSVEEYLNDGAVVIDVRTVEEFKSGHVEGSTNIVLATIPLKIDEIKKMNKRIVAVCRSGARSGQATVFLRKQGIDVINGGPWQNVARLLK